MHLTAANLAHFLTGRGLIGAEAIVAGGISVLDASRRNRNFKVLRSGAPGLFVKQMREMQADAMLTLRREAACYELAAEHPALSRLMPKLVRYEPSRHVLVLELLPESREPAQLPQSRKRAFRRRSGACWAKVSASITARPAD